MRKLKNKDLQRISVEDFKKSNKLPVTIILDNIRSALNVGSIFRTADAFLVERIVLCGITATPPNKEIRKSALGSTNSVDWVYSKNTLDYVNELRSNGYYVIGLEQVEGSTMLDKFSVPYQPIAIVIGNEINGVGQEVIDICDQAIEIPQFGTKHSLNVSVSAGIFLWDIWKKLS
tara:strand:- start:93 stop:617 length:525 start_codon:yes stop_codon:yes gene_type:complete